MAPDPFSQLKVVSWASAHADCPIRYRIIGDDEVIVVFGSGQHEFELALDGRALSGLVRLGSEALARMNTQVAEQSV